MLRFSGPSEAVPPDPIGGRGPPGREPLMETRRIDHVTVVSPDNSAAEATFRRIF